MPQSRGEKMAGMTHGDDDLNSSGMSPSGNTTGGRRSSGGHRSMSDLAHPGSSGSRPGRVGNRLPKLLIPGSTVPAANKKPEFMNDIIGVAKSSIAEPKSGQHTVGEDWQSNKARQQGLAKQTAPSQSPQKTAAQQPSLVQPLQATAPPPKPNHYNRQMYPRQEGHHQHQPQPQPPRHSHSGTAFAKNMGLGVGAKSQQHVHQQQQRYNHFDNGDEINDVRSKPIGRKTAQDEAREKQRQHDAYHDHHGVGVTTNGELFNNKHTEFVSHDGDNMTTVAQKDHQKHQRSNDGGEKLWNAIGKPEAGTKAEEMLAAQQAAMGHATDHTTPMSSAAARATQARQAAGASASTSATTGAFSNLLRNNNKLTLSTGTSEFIHRINSQQRAGGYQQQQKPALGVGRGITNIGNTCYAGSTLQLMLRCGLGTYSETFERKNRGRVTETTIEVEDEEEDGDKGNEMGDDDMMMLLGMDQQPPAQKEKEKKKTTYTNQSPIIPLHTDLMGMAARIVCSANDGHGVDPGHLIQYFSELGFFDRQQHDAQEFLMQLITLLENEGEAARHDIAKERKELGLQNVKKQQEEEDAGALLLTHNSSGSLLFDPHNVHSLQGHLHDAARNMIHKSYVHELFTSVTVQDVRCRMDSEICRTQNVKVEPACMIVVMLPKKRTLKKGRHLMSTAATAAIGRSTVPLADNKKNNEVAADVEGAPSAKPVKKNTHPKSEGTLDDPHLLSRLLATYQMNARTHDYKCDGCGKPSCSTHKTRFIHCPEVLLLHLKRFDVSFANGQLHIKKHNSVIKQDNKIRLTQYIHRRRSKEKPPKWDEYQCARKAKLQLDIQELEMELNQEIEQVVLSNNEKDSSVAVKAMEEGNELADDENIDALIGRQAVKKAPPMDEKKKKELQKQIDTLKKQLRELNFLAPQLDEDVFIPDTIHEYEFAGFVEHCGATMLSGHYVAVFNAEDPEEKEKAKSKTPPPKKEEEDPSDIQNDGDTNLITPNGVQPSRQGYKWFVADDEAMRPLTNNVVENRVTHSRNSYLISYVRTKVIPYHHSEDDSGEVANVKQDPSSVVVKAEEEGAGADPKQHGAQQPPKKRVLSQTTRQWEDDISSEDDPDDVLTDTDDEKEEEAAVEQNPLAANSTVLDLDKLSQNENGDVKDILVQTPEGNWTRSEPNTPAIRSMRDPTNSLPPTDVSPSLPAGQPVDSFPQDDSWMITDDNLGGVNNAYRANSYRVSESPQKRSLRIVGASQHVRGGTPHPVQHFHSQHEEELEEEDEADVIPDTSTRPPVHVNIQGSSVSENYAAMLALRQVSKPDAVQAVPPAAAPTHGSYTAPQEKTTDDFLQQQEAHGDLLADDSHENFGDDDVGHFEAKASNQSSAAELAGGPGGYFDATQGAADANDETRAQQDRVVERANKQDLESIMDKFMATNTKGTKKKKRKQEKRKRADRDDEEEQKTNEPKNGGEAEGEDDDSDVVIVSESPARHKRVGGPTSTTTRNSNQRTHPLDQSVQLLQSQLLSASDNDEDDEEAAAGADDNNNDEAKKQKARKKEKREKKKKAAKLKKKEQQESDEGLAKKKKKKEDDATPNEDGNALPSSSPAAGGGGGTLAPLTPTPDDDEDSSDSVAFGIGAKKK